MSKKTPSKDGRRRKAAAAKRRRPTGVTINGAPVVPDHRPGPALGTGAPNVSFALCRAARRGPHPLTSGLGHHGPRARAARSAVISETGSGATLRMNVVSSKSWKVTGCGAGFLHGFVERPGPLKSKTEVTRWTELNQVRKRACRLKPILFRLSYYDAGLFFSGAASGELAKLEFFKNKSADVKEFYKDAARTFLGLKSNPTFQVTVGNSWGEHTPTRPSPLGNDLALWTDTVEATVAAAREFADEELGGDIRRFEFDIWNEPDHKGHGKFWNEDFKSFFPVWSAACAAIRAKEGKNVRIVGPSVTIAGWNKKKKREKQGINWIKRLLRKARTIKNCWPDVLSWHDNGQKPSITRRVQEAVKLVRRYRKTNQPFPHIDINEMVGPLRSERERTETLRPGVTVHYLAEVEQANRHVTDVVRDLKKAGKLKSESQDLSEPWVRACRARFGKKPRSRKDQGQETLCRILRWDAKRKHLKRRAVYHVYEFYQKLNGRIREAHIQKDVGWIVSESPAEEGNPKKLLRLLIGRNGQLRSKPRNVKLTLQHCRRAGTTVPAKLMRHRSNETAPLKSFKARCRNRGKSVEIILKNVQKWDAFYLELKVKPLKG